MKLNVDGKTVMAVAFVIGTFAVLIASTQPNVSAKQSPKPDTKSATSQTPEDPADKGIPLVPINRSIQAVDFNMEDVATRRSRHLLNPAEHKPIVMAFWATWCQYCPYEMAGLQSDWMKYRDKVQFYGINSTDTPAKISNYMSSRHVTFPMLYDAHRQIDGTYRVVMLPTLMVVDKRNRIRLYYSGYNPKVTRLLPRVLDALLREKN